MKLYPLLAASSKCASHSLNGPCHLAMIDNIAIESKGKFSVFSGEPTLPSLVSCNNALGSDKSDASSNKDDRMGRVMIGSTLK
jgi:hypothetical protein